MRCSRFQTACPDNDLRGDEGPISQRHTIGSHLGNAHSHMQLDAHLPKAFGGMHSSELVENLFNTLGTMSTRCTRQRAASSGEKYLRHLYFDVFSHSSGRFHAGGTSSDHYDIHKAVRGSIGLIKKPA